MRLIVRAKPSSKENKVEKMGEAEFIVSVKEPPVKGRANRAVAEALAKYFKIPVAKVYIISGHTSRIKIIEIVK